LHWRQSQGCLSAALWREAFFVFEISGERRAAPQTISVVIGPGACDPNEGSVTPGPVVINVRNETQRQAIFGIVQSPPRAIEHGMLTFWPFLSGKRLLMTQTFRDNFRSEISPVARPCGEWLLSAHLARCRTTWQRSPNRALSRHSSLAAGTALRAP
jgi:hypothetical protein